MIYSVEFIEKFLEHIGNSVVKRENWCNRDTHHSHENLGKIWMLVKSGHTFEIWSDYKDNAAAKLLSEEEFFSADNLGRNIIYFYGVWDFNNFQSGECGIPKQDIVRIRNTQLNDNEKELFTQWVAKRVVNGEKVHLCYDENEELDDFFEAQYKKNIIDNKEFDNYYFPTPRQIQLLNGKDWY